MWLFEWNVPHKSQGFEYLLGLQLVTVWGRARRCGLKGGNVTEDWLWDFPRLTLFSVPSLLAVCGLRCELSAALAAMTACFHVCPL